MDESRKEWLEFTKTAAIFAMRPCQPNFNNLHIADEPLKDNLGFEYRPVTGIVFDTGPPLPFLLEWLRFYAPDDTYPDLSALVFKCYVSAKNIPLEIYVIRHVGRSGMYWGSVNIPPETPVCDLRHDPRREHLSSLAPDETMDSEF